jgi:hypothetical protein
MSTPSPSDNPSESHDPISPDGEHVNRRSILKVGLGGAAAIVIAGATGFELVSHGVLPGKHYHPCPRAGGKAGPGGIGR